MLTLSNPDEIITYTAIRRDIKQDMAPEDTVATMVTETKEDMDYYYKVLYLKNNGDIDEQSLPDQAILYNIDTNDDATCTTVTSVDAVYS